MEKLMFASPSGRCNKTNHTVNINILNLKPFKKLNGVKRKFTLDFHISVITPSQIGPQLVTACIFRELGMALDIVNY